MSSFLALLYKTANRGGGKGRWQEIEVALRASGEVKSDGQQDVFMSGQDELRQIREPPEDFIEKNKESVYLYGHLTRDTSEEGYGSHRLQSC